MRKRLIVLAALALMGGGCGDPDAGSVEVDIDRDAAGGMMVPGLPAEGDGATSPATEDALSPKAKNAPAL